MVKLKTFEPAQPLFKIKAHRVKLNFMVLKGWYVNV